MAASIFIFHILLLLLRPLHSLHHPLPILPHPHPHPPPLLRRRFHPPSPPMSAVNPYPAADKTVKMVVKGRVQGVLYRNWTVENARELGLKGWVRNRRDGAVEEMEQRCRRGPPDRTSDLLLGATFERRPTV